jgi:hypothetical protein
MIQNDLQSMIINFSKLSDQNCALLLQSRLLEALEIEDPTFLEWEMLAKFISVDYSLRDDLCKFLNYYLKRNSQNIAGIQVNVWLKKYLDKYARIPREPETFLRYATSNPEIKRLNEKDQIRLMRIFRLYDYLLVEPVPDLDCPQAINLMRFPMRLSKPLREILAEMSSAQTEETYSSQTVSEHLPVKEALQKFQKIGEQAVTNSPIKLKSFDRPVRPSIRNWLYDYTSHLGQTGHSSMDRTNYLFRSENAVKLSSLEKEKLSIILRSFDENTPLPIDAGRQEVVFGEFMRKAPSQVHRTQATLQHKAASSINFIHHVERKTAQQGPSANTRFTESENKPPSELFIRPYAEAKPSVDMNLDQAPPFSHVPGAQPFPSSVQATETSRDQVLDNFPNPNNKMKFINPYPSPGTHESNFEKKNDNIANVSFSEGIPGIPIAHVSAKRMTGASVAQSLNSAPKIAAPAQKPAPGPRPQAVKPSYQYPQPNRNIIYPHLAHEFPGGRPEPKIKGNVVDLKGDQQN